MGLSINLVWHKPIQLTKGGKLVAPEDEIASAIEKNSAGVYVFSRKHGKRYIPFYIGQSTVLRSRLVQHMKRNVQLMKIIEGYGEEAKAVGQGARYFQYATVTSRRNLKRTLEIVERALIRRSIADDLYIINKNNTKIETHTVYSSGPTSYRAIFDKTTSVESQT